MTFWLFIELQLQTWPERTVCRQQQQKLQIWRRLSRAKNRLYWRCATESRRFWKWNRERDGSEPRGGGRRSLPDDGLTGCGLPGRTCCRAAPSWQMDPGRFSTSVCVLMVCLLGTTRLSSVGRDRTFSVYIYAVLWLSSIICQIQISCLHWIVKSRLKYIWNTCFNF